MGRIDEALDRIEREYADKIVVWRATPHGKNAPWAYDESLPSLVESIEDGADPGAMYLLECVEMSRADYDALEDFNVW